MEVELIVHAITQGFEQLRADIEQLAKSTDKVAETSKTQAAWVKLTSKLWLAHRAFMMVERGATMAWDALEEGANVELIGVQFGRLTASIGSDADKMLRALQDASRGMIDNAGLMDQANQLIALGLASTEEEVVRLSTVVSKLGWNMQQVILTFANNSEKRLDTLGLSIDDVRARAKALELQGYNTDKAFDLAVIEAGEAKIRLVGDTADQTAGDLKVLQASLTDLKHEFELTALEAAKPIIVNAVNYATFVPKTTQAIKDMRSASLGAKEELSRLAAAYQQLDFSDVNIIQRPILQNSAVVKAAAREMRDNISEIAATNINWETSTRRITEQLAELSPEFEVTSGGVVKFQGHVIGLISELRALSHELNQQALNDYSAGMEELARSGRIAGESIVVVDAAVRATNRALFDHGIGLRMDTREMEDLAYATGDLGTAQERMQQYLDEDKKKLGEAADAAAAYADALDSITAATISDQFGFIDEMAAQLENLRKAQGEWVQTTRDTSAEIDAINSQLAADLTDDQRKAWQEVAKNAEEGSARWLEAMRALDADLGDSKRNELLIARAELEAAMGQPISVFTGDYAGMEEAKKRIEELTAEMEASYANAILEATMAGSGFDEVAANTAVALGIMTRAQADARLEAIALAQTMTAIGEAIRSGAVTPDRAAEMFDALTAAAQGTAADLKIAIDRIKAEIAGIDVVAANVDTTASTSAAGLKQAMLEMEGVLKPAADDAQSKLDTLNDTDIVVTVVDTELVDLKSLMIEVNEKQGIITSTVTKPPGDDSELAPVKASLGSILDMINAINSTEVSPGSTAGGGTGAGSATGGATGGSNNAAGGTGGGSGSGGTGPGTTPAAPAGPSGLGANKQAGTDNATAASAAASAAAASSAARNASAQAGAVVNNFSNGMGPAAVSALISSAMARYTRGAR